MHTTVHTITTTSNTFSVATVRYHGDLVEVTGSQGDCGGVVIHGRSDTTLKPGGVRIGTAEVYRFAETVAAVDDSLVIGDQIKVGKRAGDVRIGQWGF